jgi:ParB family chromosome partitioning protein
LIVRRHEAQFQLVGERRGAPLELAGLTGRWLYKKSRILLLELALIENIQREDLNAIETARAYERLGRD